MKQMKNEKIVKLPNYLMKTKFADIFKNIILSQTIPTI